MKRSHAMPFGATVGDRGVSFRLWATGAVRVELGLEVDGATQWWPMNAIGDGWHEMQAALAHAGSRYRYRLDGDLVVPDPASRFNPDDVHGASVVVDPAAFEWPDASWQGRPWHEAVIYELHVGTFSAEGTFRAVADRLDHLVSLGVTAIELMPLADFPGARNWGYDGVLPFAPDAAYGTPDDLKALIAAAHGRGLMVFVDVVYNHFGPEGNYLPRLAPDFFTDRHRTPWGAAINFDGPGSRTVRDYFVHNALYWIEEFHVDGLRLDAVHAIADDSRPDILSELAAAVRTGPGRLREVHLILENDRNESYRLDRDAQHRPVQFTAQWNDDFHHALHHLLTGENRGYYADYAARPVAQLGRCLAEGFAYQGDASAYRQGEPRGSPSAALPAEAFVNFLQNHDQVGNRAFGERLSTLAPDYALRTALAIMLLAPSPPLLFMGEEFGAVTPFLFFCDFEPALASAVREGRRAEFAGFPPFDDDAAAERIPDPGAQQTSADSGLDWDSVSREPHAAWLAYYRALLARRAQAVVPLLPQLIPGQATFLATEVPRVLAVRWPLAGGSALVLHARLGAAGEAPRLPPDADLVFATGEAAQPGWNARWHVQRSATG